MDGIAGCANAFIIMGPDLVELLLSPVDSASLASPSSGFYLIYTKREWCLALVLK